MNSVAAAGAGLAVGFFLLRRSSTDAPEGFLDGYEPETGCAGESMGARALRSFVLAHFGGGNLGISRLCDPATESGHEQGSAWDWGVLEGQTIPPTPYTTARVQAALRWLTDDDGRRARALGLMYMIYNRRGWYAYPRDGQPAGTWHAYKGASAHVDHVHFSLSRAGAAAETSGYDNGQVRKDL